MNKTIEFEVTDQHEVHICKIPGGYALIIGKEPPRVCTTPSNVGLNIVSYLQHLEAIEDDKLEDSLR